MRDLSYTMDRERMSKFDTSNYPRRKEEVRYWLSIVQFAEMVAREKRELKHNETVFRSTRIHNRKAMEDFDPHCIVDFRGALCGDPECLPLSSNTPYRNRQLAQVAVRDLDSMRSCCVDQVQLCRPD